jgi:uncharacterized protein (UPF0303 family)
VTDPTTTTGGRLPADLLAEEASLVLPSLSELDAIALGERILTRAIREQLPVAIEVRRAARVVFRAALPGSTPDNDSWIARKARVAERFEHASLYCRVVHEAAGTTFEGKTGLPFDEYAPFGGAVPLSVVGTGQVGVAIVSGLPQLDDHDLVVSCIRDHLADLASVAASVAASASATEEPRRP